MSHKERRLREKEAMKRLIVDSAMDIVSNRGLTALTTRSLAEQIEYSTAVIYEYFETKEDIYQELNVLLCIQLLAVLKQVPHSSNPEEYFLELFKANILFLDKKPHLIELLTRMCFGPNPSLVPVEYKEVELLFANALKACHCKQLKTQKAHEDAIDILRSLHVGTLILSQYERSTEGLKRIEDSFENGIKHLLASWKS